MVLEVRDISKYYGLQQVVKNVSFSIDKGDIVGFLGINGAGKSTIMKMISGCITIDSGSITIANNDLKEQPIAAKSHIGFIPENNPLYDEMYISEYLEYVANLYAVDDVKERIIKTVCQTGLQSDVHKKIALLSKGCRQRVGIAQAIIHQPDILILDEPTAALDPNQIEKINRLLISLSKNTAIFFSSHSLTEVQKIATRILFIKRGEILADQNSTENLDSLFKELD